MTKPLRRLVLATLALLPAAALAQPHHGGGGGGGGGQGRGGGGGGRGGGGGGGPPQGRGNQGGGNQGGGGGGGHGRGGPPGFGSDTGSVVQGWRTANPSWSPRPLPPGQMRQLARGRPLPPGIARQQVPPGLVSQLPVYPGHSYAMIGSSLVLLGAGGVVVDIFSGF